MADDEDKLMKDIERLENNNNQINDIYAKERGKVIEVGDAIR